MTHTDASLVNTKSELSTAETALQTIINSLTQAASDLDTARNDLSKEQECILAGRFDFCRITYEEKKAGSDLEASPTLEDGSTVKVGVFRGVVELGEDFDFPISVLYADVNDTPTDGDATANALKLADPEQGLNLTVDYGGYWSAGGLCRGVTSARCFAGINGGVRYLELTESGSDATQKTFGGMVTAKINAVVQNYYRTPA